MSGDFEVMPIGTKARLEELESYARKASGALARMASGGRYGIHTLTRGGLELADPLFCEGRVETRIRNAGRRHRP